MEAYEREARQKRRQRRLLDAQKAFDSSRSTVRSRQASLCEAEEAQKKASEADKWEKRQAAARLQAAQQAQVLLERRAIEHKKKLRQVKREHGGLGRSHGRWGGVMVDGEESW